ncbi:MAG: LapA family protein [Thermodesulfobacteriota bacterium]
MRTLKVYLYGLLILLFAVFILQNYTTLTNGLALRLNLGFISLISVPLPLYLIAPILFFSGVFLATVIGWGERRRLNKEIKQLKAASRQEIRQEGKQDPLKEIKTEPVSAPKPASDPVKKNEGGTIVSPGPLLKKDPSSGDKPLSRP